MSLLERSFCRSAPWRSFAERVVLPWALGTAQPSGDLLEIGGGSGAMAEALAHRHPTAHVTTSDVDPAMVRMAARRSRGCPNLDATTADVTALPFADKSFDYVVSFLMLHHVIEWPAALAEARRVLRPGGRLIGYDLDDTRTARLIHLVDRSPHRLVARSQLQQALEAAGFDVVHVRRSLGGQAFRFAATARE